MILFTDLKIGFVIFCDFIYKKRPFFYSLNVLYPAERTQPQIPTQIPSETRFPVPDPYKQILTEMSGKSRK